MLASNPCPHYPRFQASVAVLVRTMREPGCCLSTSAICFTNSATPVRCTVGSMYVAPSAQTAFTMAYRAPFVPGRTIGVDDFLSAHLPPLRSAVGSFHFGNAHLVMRVPAFLAQVLRNKVPGFLLPSTNGCFIGKV